MHERCAPFEKQIRIALYGTRSAGARPAGMRISAWLRRAVPGIELIFAQRIELNYSSVVGYWERAR